MPGARTASPSPPPSMRKHLAIAALASLGLACPGFAQSDDQMPKLYQLPSTGAPGRDEAPGVSPQRPPAANDPGGVEAAGALERVVGGTPATHGDWPSLVLVNILDRAGHKRATCGGTVIAPRWVLTAAHCAAGSEGFSILEGTDNLRQGGHLVAVDSALVHPNYSHDPTPHNDVALLHLRSGATSSPQLLLGKEAKQVPFDMHKGALVAGFGLTLPQTDGEPHRGSTSDKLMAAELPLVDQKTCGRVLQAAMHVGADKLLDDTTLCAGDMRGGRDSCNGDSGGPLTEPISGRKVQIGVVSWGPGCAQKDTVGVYAAVSTFEDWIRGNVRDARFYTAPSAPPDPTSLTAVNAAAVAAGLNPDIVVELVEGHSVPLGTKVHFRVTSAIPGKLLLYNVELPSGRAYQIYPNKYTASTERDGVIEPGRALTVPGDGDRFAFRLKEPLGDNRLFAFVLPRQTRIADLASRGMDMDDLADAPAVFDEVKERALRGVGIEPTGAGGNKTQGANVFDYEITR